MKGEKNVGGRFAALCMVFLVCLILGIIFGSTRASITDALHALKNGDMGSATLRIYLYVRLPRVAAAILSGSALAVAGALIQAVLQNPMAAPNVIGVNSGAGFAVSIVVALFPTAIWAMPVAAFGGALAACMLIYLIAAQTGANRTTITLVGVAISSIFSAGMNAIKTVFPESMYNTSTFLIGGIAGVQYSRLLPPACIIVLGICTALVCARQIDVLSLGADPAASLGMNVRAFRFAMLALASALAGSAVSFAGLLGFVGLLVPHISRRIVGGSHRKLLPFCAVAGATLVLACDLLGRVLFAPYELPVGIILSFIGGPFFITQILMQRKHGHD